MKMFKIVSYHPEPDESVVVPTRPMYVGADAYEYAHSFACKTLGVLNPQQLVLAPHVGRLPPDAVVLDVHMTFEEVYGALNATAELRGACG